MTNNGHQKLFECHRCGKCCTEIGLPYDPEKILKIADFLELTIDQVIDKYYGRSTEDSTSWISDDNKRTPCPFIKRTGKHIECKIYPVRPEGCTAYPFATDSGKGGVDCPGAETIYKKLNKEE